MKVSSAKRTGIIGLAAVALMLASQAYAKADTDQFLTDAGAAGFTNGGGNQALISVGETICGLVGSGESEDAVAHDLWRVSQLQSLDMATVLVNIAVSDLCPNQGTAPA